MTSNLLSTSSPNAIILGETVQEIGSPNIDISPHQLTDQTNGVKYRLKSYYQLGVEQCKAKLSKRAIADTIAFVVSFVLFLLEYGTLNQTPYYIFLGIWLPAIIYSVLSRVNGSSYPYIHGFATLFLFVLLCYIGLQIPNMSFDNLTRFSPLLATFSAFAVSGIATLGLGMWKTMRKPPEVSLSLPIYRQRSELSDVSQAG